MFKKINNHLEKSLTTEQFSYTNIRKLFIPLLLDQLFISIISILSASMVSSSGEAAIAAVNLVNSLAFLVMALFSSISTGGTVVVARAKGSQDLKQLKRAAGNTVFLTSTIAFLSTFILVVFNKPIVYTIFNGAENILLEYACLYLSIYGLSFIPFGLYNSCIAVMRGIGDSKSCLFMTIIINLTHLICSFIFINIFNLGVAGSALSFVVARVIGGVAAIIWVFIVRRNVFEVYFSDIFKIKVKIIAEILKLGIPFALEQIFFQGGILITQTYIAALSITQIAANAVANSIYNFVYMTGFALSTMTVTIIGQCIGAKNIELAKHYTQKIIKYGNYLLLLTVIVVIPLLPVFFKIFNASSEAIPIVLILLALAFIPYPIIWTRAYIYPSTFRAAGDANFTTIVSLFAMWVARVGLGYVLAVLLNMGVYGIWITVSAELLIRAIIFNIRFKKDKWIKIKLEKN